MYYNRGGGKARVVLQDVVMCKVRMYSPKDHKSALLTIGRHTATIWTPTDQVGVPDGYSVRGRRMAILQPGQSLCTSSEIGGAVCNHVVVAQVAWLNLTHQPYKPDASPSGDIVVVAKGA